MRRWNAFSFASAAAFVSGPIHESVGMSSRSAATRLSMSEFIFAFASGVKLRRTYSCPSSWPMLASAERTQRFQRSCCSFVPDSVLPPKLKSSFDERAGERRRGAVDDLPAQQRLPVFERDVVEQLADGLDVLRLRDVERRRGDAEVLEVGRPVDGRRHRRQLGHRGRVIGVLGNALLDARELRGGQLRLQLEDALARRTLA